MTETDKRPWWKEKPSTLQEEVVLIRKRLGWIVFWLIVIALCVGAP